jgi:hypothetical protein
MGLCQGMTLVFLLPQSFEGISCLAVLVQSQSI